MTRTDVVNTRDDLVAFCERFGLTYKVHSETVCDNWRGDKVIESGWVDFFNPKARRPERPLMFVALPDMSHWTMCGFGLRRNGRSRQQYRDIKDRMLTDEELISSALSDILSGCRIKVARKRSIDLPPASSVQELLLKMEVVGN